MWTKKSALMLCMGAGLPIFALVAKNVQLLAVSIFLLTSLVVGMFNNRQAKLAASRALSGEKIFEDGQIIVDLKLQNRGARTGFLEVRDKLPKQLNIREGSNYLIVDLKQHESTTIRYKLEAPLKGIYTLGPISIRMQDVFNLFYEEVDIDFTDNISVFPRVEDIKEIPIKSRAPKMYPGASPVKQPGPGSEFFLIRDYVPGDAFKQINWKAYARSGKLLVNEKEREAVSDITIVFDARSTSAIGSEADNALIYGARAAATLTNFFLKRRDSVALIVYGEKLMTIKPGMGKKQLFEVLTALAGTRSEGNLPLKGVVDVSLPYMPRKSPIILISNLENDNSIAKACSDIRILDFSLTVISPNPIEFELLARTKARQPIGDPMAYEVLKAERDIKIEELRGYGAKIIDWDPNMPFTAVLAQLRT